MAIILAGFSLGAIVLAICWSDRQNAPAFLERLAWLLAWMFLTLVAAALLLPSVSAQEPAVVFGASLAIAVLLRICVFRMPVE